MSDANKEERDRLHTETRKDLLSRQLSNSQIYDRTILTVSVSAITIPIAFLKFLVPYSDALLTELLLASWCLFGLSIIVTMASMLTSQQGIKIQLDYAQKYYMEQKKEYFKKPNKYAKITDKLNKLSGGMFIIAIILTVLFLTLNFLGGKPIMTDKTGHRVDEGADIPSMQQVQGGVLKKGADIPDLQQVQNTQNQSDAGQGQSSGDQSGSSQGSSQSQSGRNEKK